MFNLYIDKAVFPNVIKEAAITSIYKKGNALGGCSFDIPSSYFFRISKVWCILHSGSVGQVQNKRK